MKEQRLKAMAKINLGLDVLRRRPDGYHDLRMVMQTVNLYDEITLKAEEQVEPERFGLTETPDIRLSVYGGAGLVPADENNLVYRAARLLMEEFGIGRRLEIILEKRIPTAAGLAGGSSDAAAVLVGINRMFELNLSEEELMRRGVQIGADVPYCVMRGTALAEGIGDRLTRLPQAPEAHVLLVKPPVWVSTKYVYTNLKLDETCRHPDIAAQVQAIRDGDLLQMAKYMGNVLESVTIPAFPVIKEIKDQMMGLGAVGAMMSGSGPTVFGLFKDQEAAGRAYEILSEEERMEAVFLTTFFETIPAQSAEPSPLAKREEGMPC